MKSNQERNDARAARTNGWIARDTPLIVAHRGASADALENTLAAFALALEQGADGVELDVQLSADGRPVVFHDFSVERLTGVAGSVAQMTVAELQALDLGGGQMVPTLDEVLSQFGPRTLYNIEIKDFGLWDRGLETAVANRVASYHLENHVLISSFNPLALRRARRVFSSSTPMALIRERGLLRYGYLIADGAADHPHHSLVDANYMGWARKRGYRVNVWTVDDPGEARRLAALGVDGIVTNKPRLIRAALAEAA